VVAISTDDTATLKKFKEKTKAPYPLLSDPEGKVASAWVGLMPVVKVAKRANFVVGKDGLVKEVVEGSDAIDPTAAVNACSAEGGKS
jgi:peroxiredoxin